MPANTAERERLRSIKSFPSLVKYLRDDLNWPIESEDFEEISFDYTAEELGIDQKTAAKIQEIKQLRPLVTGQPWGIFFVKFEPKRLPVVALRRILSRLVVKKRESANKSDRAAWEQKDLLFISNYGEGEERQITFAHFNDNNDHGDLPTLKVLGWDDKDTALHLDHVHEELHSKLRWPDDDRAIEPWRQQWRGAFELKHREVITTSKQLAIRLAQLAQEIRSRCNAAMRIETENGPIRSLMSAFKQALIHDLDDDRFADMYAQTIAYGLLSARVSRPAHLVADNLADMVPVTNPFLKELMQTFLNVGGRKWNDQRGRLTGIDFDELGINDVVDTLRHANMEAVLRDFGNRNPAEDPVIHFYELFLKEYDADMRMQRGVFYTPRPVVSYIVRSVHELLQTEFGLADGLADTATWADMLKRNKDLQLPEVEVVDPKTRKVSKKPIDPNSPFVQILDPATGTATFLVEAVDLIYKTMAEKWKKQGDGDLWISQKWNDYVPKHLLPRLNGYELMMAPYAIAHMKIGLKLFETGYQFGSGERARIYLTNALEPAQDFSDTFEQMAPALAHEASAVNDVKRYRRFTVVIGNPPYSKLSSNWNEWIDGLLHGKGSDSALTSDYYQVDGAALGERTVWIQDDYIKFTRFSQWQIDRSGTGIHGYISNNGYLDNPTLRGMRQQLNTSFAEMYVFDLHGSTKRGEIGPDGQGDANVFDIQQGVAIGIFVKRKSASEKRISHAHLWGDRTHKYETLLSDRIAKQAWSTVSPCSPFHLFVPIDSSNQSEYNAFWKITDIFPKYHTGIITKRDALTIHWSAADVLRTASDFVALTPAAARSKYQLPEDVRDWKVEWAQADLRKAGISKERAIPVLYRPFDIRYTYFTGHTRGFVGWPVADMTKLMLAGDNIALITTRMTKGEDFGHVMVSRWMAEVICLSSKTSNNAFVFPLYAASADSDGLIRRSKPAERESNLSAAFAALLPQRDGDLQPANILNYVFAILQSPSYRTRFREFLSRDFPRIPIPNGEEIFRELSSIGGELVGLQLMESKSMPTQIATYTGGTEVEVGRVTHEKHTVWLDKDQTAGFAGVTEEIWNFHIGGYQVCEKWLKDRKGRTLSKEDIQHYRKIIVAISETIRLMTEIDEVIDKYGGWPGAFVTTPIAAKAAEPEEQQLPFA
jgi:hypothetical protein